MAASEASSSSAGERSPARNASTREQASPCQGASGMAGDVRTRTLVRTYGPPPMDARTFLGLESDGTPSGFRLPVVPGITAGGGFLFGGCGLGAAIVALEEITER